MALQLFDVDASDMKRLLALYAKGPRRFARGSAMMLNEFAFGTRYAAIEVIRERMTVRNQRFVERQLRVDKAAQTAPITRQIALTGSVREKRFSGWREQQTGVRTARERVINLLARGRSQKRQARRPARMLQGRSFKSYRDFPGRGTEQRTITMLQRLDRQRWKQPFIIHQKRGMIPGLYKFYRRKPRLLQVFRPENIQPKKIPWLTDARSRYFARADIGHLWRETLKILLKP